MEWEKGMNQIYIKNGYVKSQTKVSVGEKKTQILKSMIQGKKSTQNTCLYFVCIHIYVIKLENMHDEEKEKQL